MMDLISEEDFKSEGMHDVDEDPSNDFKIPHNLVSNFGCNVIKGKEEIKDMKIAVTQTIEVERKEVET
jgi:hypothetical protein